MTDRNKLKLVSSLERKASLENQVVEEVESKNDLNIVLLISFLIFSLTVTFIVVGFSGLFPDTLSRKDIGKTTHLNIIARRSFTFVPDNELLKKKSDEAARNVLPVYTYRRNGWLDLWQREIKYGFRSLKDPIFNQKEDLARKRFNELTHIKLDKTTFWALNNSLGFSKIKPILQSLFTAVLKNKILVKDVGTLKSKYPSGIEILVYTREGGEYNSRPIKIFTGSLYGNVVDLSKLHSLFQSEIETRYSLGDENNLGKGARRALLTLCVVMVKSHISSMPKSGKSLGIVPAPKLTRKRRKEVEEKVTVITKEYSKGDVILKSGDKITLETVKIFAAMIHSLGSRIFWFMGEFILVMMFFLSIGWFATLGRGIKTLHVKDFYVFAGMFLLFMGLVRGSWYLVSGMLSNPDPIIYPAIFPAAGAAFIIRVLMGNRFAIYFSISIAFLATWAIGAPVYVSLFYFMTGLVASGAVERVEHRQVIWKSALMIVGMNFLLVLIFRLMRGDLLHTQTLWYMLAGIGGGLISGILMSSLLPLVEYAGDYITDIKLLELTNTDNPLLQMLNEKASGTYMHSQTVAQLAFSAAKKVGAKALLVKVAAFYHDVGKTVQSRFFIENQTGENAHDKLKPSMSTLIIKNHIKDTREILEKHGIPKLVIDIASSHHGTTLIEYFYRRAQENAGPEEVIQEEDYRYPGPIPQTREAGILMLADTVEAAVRSRVKSLQIKGKDARPQQFDVNTIKAVVQQIINKKFTDGQLDACELTLRDLSIIAGSFITTLSSIHHERVSYPSSPGEKTNANRRVSSSLPVIEKKQEGKSTKESKKNSKSSKSDGK
jgi:putative nucleotidyltransferase with HDIG domain